MKNTLLIIIVIIIIIGFVAGFFSSQNTIRKAIKFPASNNSSGAVLSAEISQTGQTKGSGSIGVENNCETDPDFLSKMPEYVTYRDIHQNESIMNDYTMIRACFSSLSDTEKLQLTPKNRLFCDIISSGSIARLEEHKSEFGDFGYNLAQALMYKDKKYCRGNVECEMQIAFLDRMRESDFPSKTIFRKVLKNGEDDHSKKLEVLFLYHMKPKLYQEGLKEFGESLCIRK